MGRFRSFVRRAAKPAAMVAVVGTLSLSLIVTTPSNAQAFTDYSKIAAPVIQGAVKTAAPALLAGAVRLHPVGFMISNVISLGTMLYDTREQWYPFVAGLWGNAEGTLGNSPATGGIIHPAGITISGGSTLNGVTYSWTKDDPAWDREVLATLVKIRCQKSDGTQYTTTLQRNTTWGNSTVTNYPKTRTLTHYCDLSAHTAIGWIVGAPNAVADLTYPFTAGYGGPGNVLSSGNMAQGGTAAFDPRGAGTTYKARAECIDSSGTKSWIESVTAGNEGAIKFPSCAGSGKGHGTGLMEVTGLRPGGAPSEEKILWDIPTAPSDPSTPLCDPGRTGSGCTLEVTKNGEPCTTGDVECENWQEDSQKEGNSTKYGCKLGPYTLPLSACNLLSKAYRPGGAPATEENTDGNPATNNDLGPDGKPADVSAPPVVGTVPGGSGKVEPSSPDEKARQCFPTGWAAFNPIEWVLKPLRCAFEPTTDVKDMVTRLGIRSATKAPISFLTLEMLGPQGGGCPNWTINVEAVSKNVICESSFTAALRGVRTPLFGLLSCAMVWPLIRSLWYAAIPILRVSPSGGK